MHRYSTSSRNVIFRTAQKYTPVRGHSTPSLSRASDAKACRSRRGQRHLERAFRSPEPHRRGQSERSALTQRLSSVTDLSAPTPSDGGYHSSYSEDTRRDNVSYGSSAESRFCLGLQLSWYASSQTQTLLPRSDAHNVHSQADGSPHSNSACCSPAGRPLFDAHHRRILSGEQKSGRGLVFVLSAVNV